MCDAHLLVVLQKLAQPIAIQKMRWLAQTSLNVALEVVQSHGGGSRTRACTNDCMQVNYRP